MKAGYDGSCSILICYLKILKEKMWWLEVLLIGSE